MLLYLDLNCFNRPFDDQGQERIARETEAVFRILQRIVTGADQLSWSGVLDFENSKHPKADRRIEIGSWKKRAAVYVEVDEFVARRARAFEAVGLAALDAAHLACAEVAGCDEFLTCDDRLARRAQRADLRTKVKNPLEYIKDQEDGRANDR